MKIDYNSHIIKLADVEWQRDQANIFEALKASQGASILIRATQAPAEKRQVTITSPDLAAAFENAEINLGQPFHIEIVIRNPLPLTAVQDALQGQHGYEDKGDYNSFQWAGKRGTGSVPRHSVRNSPLFFSDNGMNLDLIDKHAGGSVFLILNGPSFATVDHDSLRQPGIITFGTNNGAQLFRPRYWTCVDDPTRFTESIWTDPLIEKFVPMAHFQKPIWDHKRDVISEFIVADFENVVGFRRNEQFKPEQWLYEDTINWGNHKDLGGGRSVMLSALRICYLLGFRKVYLLGCDFFMAENRKYWFPEQRDPGAIRNNMNSFETMRGYFAALLPHFQAEDFSVINCTEGTALDVFPKMKLSDAVAQTFVPTDQSTDGMYINRNKY